MSDKELSHRLNRAIGQINAIKRNLESEEPHNCMELLQQLKASINALKKFGEHYLNKHLEECLESGKDPKEVKEDLKGVISGAFSL